MNAFPGQAQERQAMDARNQAGARSDAQRDHHARRRSGSTESMPITACNFDDSSTRTAAEALHVAEIGQRSGGRGKHERPTAIARMRRQRKRLVPNAIQAAGTVPTGRTSD